MLNNDVDGTLKKNEGFKTEFSIKKLSLIVDDPQTFVSYVANKDSIPKWYLLFKLMSCSLISIIIISDITIESLAEFGGRFYVWFFYATNWSYTSLWLYFLFSCINTGRYFMSQRNYAVIKGNSDNDSESYDVWTSVLFFLHSVSCNISLLVTLIYWIFFHTLPYTQYEYLHTAKLELAMSGTKHTFNSVIILVDLFIGNIPIRLLHVIYPLLIGLLYCFCSIVFFELNFGKYTYGSFYTNLNWLENPERSATICLMAIFFILPVQILLYLIYRIKIFLLKTEN